MTQEEIDRLFYGFSLTDKATGERIDPKDVEVQPDGIRVGNKKYVRRKKICEVTA